MVWMQDFTHMNKESRLERIVDFAEHDVFVGQVVQTHADPGVLTDGQVDIGKVKPLLFDMASKRYRTLGPSIGNAWGGKNAEAQAAIGLQAGKVCRKVRSWNNAKGVLKDSSEMLKHYKDLIRSLKNKPLDS